MLGLASSEGLGSAGGRGSTFLLLDDLTDANEVSIKVYDCELSKAPGFVFKSVHARDACAGQMAGQA